MESFNLLGLDEDFVIIQNLRPINVQWNRKYHEAGGFSIQLPVNQYTTDLKYIYTKDRPEMGKIESVNYISLTSGSYIQIRGFFLEHELARMICFPKGNTNILSSPSWEFREGKAEDVAIEYYNGFRRIKTSEVDFDLGIDPVESQHRGKDSIHYRNEEDLAYKLYDILKPSGMSYRVLYDLNANTRTMEVWSGLDRTQDNEDGNNPIIFSTKYKNVYKPNILIDESDYKNGCIVVHETREGDNSTYISRVAFNGDEDIRLMTIRATANRSEYSEADFYIAMENEGLNELLNNVKEINLEFDALAGSYIYGEDFDLGDMCSVEIPEMGLTADVRLIGCYEVMKDGGWTMTMEFGTPMIK